MRKLSAQKLADFTAMRLVSHYRDDIIDRTVASVVEERDYIVARMLSFFNTFDDVPTDGIVAETAPSKRPLTDFDYDGIE